MRHESFAFLTNRMEETLCSICMPVEITYC